MLDCIPHALRWIGFLPAAIIAAWVAWFGLNLANRVTMTLAGVSPESLLMRAYIEAISGAVLGYAFAYVGSRIAPTHQHRVLVVLVVCGLLFDGVLLAFALMATDYWSIWSAVWVAMGLAGTLKP